MRNRTILYVVICCWITLFYNGCHGEGEIRLSGGGSEYGRVEIYHDGEWGTVCTDHFDFNAVQVICRELGLPIHPYDFYHGPYSSPDPPITWLHTFTCSGSESSLVDCSISHWGIAISDTCASGVAAGVWCGESATTVTYSANEDHTTVIVSDIIESGSIRLTGENSNSRSGRVEVYYLGQWGTVCDASSVFSDTEANVVCRQLNHTSDAHTIKEGAHFGRGSGPVLDIDCTGFEIHVSQCIIRPTQFSSCTHSRDVGVICNYVSPRHEYKPDKENAYALLPYVLVPPLGIVCFVAYLIYFKCSRRHAARGAARGAATSTYPRRRITPMVALKNFFRPGQRPHNMTVAPRAQHVDGNDRRRMPRFQLSAMPVTDVATSGVQRTDLNVSGYQTVQALNPAYPPSHIRLGRNQNEALFTTNSSGITAEMQIRNGTRFYPYSAELPKPPSYTEGFNGPEPPSYDAVFGTKTTQV